MSKPWRLTKRAERSLFQIAVWTRQTFGDHQADAYEQKLLACCEAIAAGTARKQSCQTLFDIVLPNHLYATRVGGHFAIFVESNSEIIIFDFLHAQRDLPGRLTGISKAEAN